LGVVGKRLQRWRAVDLHKVRSKRHGKEKRGAMGVEIGQHKKKHKQVLVRVFIP